MSNAPPQFDEYFRAQLHRLLAWRRDVRRFRSEPLPPDVLPRLISIACSAPSVGLSQPWRFVVVDEPARRRAIIDEFHRCNLTALRSYTGSDAFHYARLKLSGLEAAPCHLAVFTDRKTAQGKYLGRLTMPETADYSVVAAICILWLAARAEGIGVGWVSILDPDRVAAILAVPAEWQLTGYLCLGYPEQESDRPELERAHWEARKQSAHFLIWR